MISKSVQTRILLGREIYVHASALPSSKVFLEYRYVFWIATDHEGAQLIDATYGKPASLGSNRSAAVGLNEVNAVRIIGPVIEVEHGSMHEGYLFLGVRPATLPTFGLGVIEAFAIESGLKSDLPVGKELVLSFAWIGRDVIALWVIVGFVAVVAARAVPYERHVRGGEFGNAVARFFDTEPVNGFASADEERLGDLHAFVAGGDFIKVPKFEQGRVIHAEQYSG